MYLRLFNKNVTSNIRNLCCTRKLCNVGFPNTASTIVIGGGATGTSLTYHLAKQGQKNVILLDKLELTAGSTWHAAGLTASFNSGINMKKIHHYSINLYSQITEETGQEVSFHQVGSIRLAFTPERVQEFKYQMTRAGCHDNPQCLLTPEEVKEKAPLLKTDKLLMGLHNPYDGYIDPYSLTQALAKGARNYGASIYQNCPVTALKLNGDNTWTVFTPKGEIKADKIVNAAGFHAKDVGKMAGSDLPLISAHHQYLVTSTMPEVEALTVKMPVLRHMEGSCYIREEKQGLVLGCYEAPETVKMSTDWSKNGVPAEFGRELYPSDLERMMPYLNRVMEDLPALTTANIQSIINGPIVYSPDGLPLIGPDTLPNLWNLNGFSFGIIQAGGAGKYLADWMINGEPTFDLIECDALRFKSWASDEYAEQKIPETYGLVNTVGYTNEERFAGRNQRTTKAFTKQLDRGAHMQVHSGWEQPAWFALPGTKAEYIPTFKRGNWHEPLAKEYETVTKNAGVIDLTPFSKYMIEGKDSVPFLNYVTANKLPKVNRSVVTHLLSNTGKIFAELTITRTGENSFFVITGSGSELHDLNWLDQQARINNYDITFKNVTSEYACLSVAGPQSAKVLEKLSSKFKDPFPFMSAQKLEIADIENLALRITYTGELGWELYHPIDKINELYEAILDAGKEYGIGDFGTMMLNTLRLEKGFKMWGSEMNIDRNPVEADLMYFIKPDKGEFIGREAIKSQLQNLQKQKLVMAIIDPNSESDPHGDETIWLEGKVDGNTTSGCWSFLLNRPLMFCYVPPYLSTPGQAFKVELPTGMYTGQVIKGPPAIPYHMRK